jgi:hypothetical protein
MNGTNFPSKFDQRDAKEYGKEPPPPDSEILAEVSAKGDGAARQKTRTFGHFYCGAYGVDGLSFALFIGLP